ncbi:sulfurtransferase [Alloalcanivorax mobilis]|uniref:sulfurtransferase n=1 Tax=Alloalcanivorax mobilis TaxID=2019569 RepID=UPI000C776FFC|nr:rhodanese-like domain-containing protein [Alloalcanivorax mobilis]
MTAPLPLLLEPEELARHLDDANLLIVDLSKGQVHDQAHVPGAIHLDFKRLLAGNQPAPGLLPDDARLSSLFSELGLTPDTQVVAYDDEGGGWAARLLWTLDVIGHKKYAYLNGGIHGWLAAELPTDSERHQPEASDYTVGEHDPVPSVDLDHVWRHYRDPDTVIWDARSEEEYAGVRAFAQKGGHIPGARLYEWTNAMDKHSNLRVRDREEIRRELAALGIEQDKQIITHCQTHHRSSFTWLIGRILGFDNIRGYPGSWSEWGNHPDTPFEKSD